MPDVIYLQLVPFCAVDVHGQVIVRGTTMDLPQLEGLTVLAEDAPDGCYRIADAWQTIPAAPSARHAWDWSVHAWVDCSLEQLRAAKLAEINAAFRAESSALVVGYPPEERQTWPAQEAEALAWADDDTAATPYLDGIAAARGIAPAAMRAKTLDAVLAFRVESQWLVGTRQALRDAITDPTIAREQLEALAWPSHSQE